MQNEWLGEPLDEITEIRLREAVGGLKQGIDGLQFYLTGIIEFVDNLELEGKRKLLQVAEISPADWEQLKDSTLKELTQLNTTSQTLTRLVEGESIILNAVKFVNTPGVAHMATGLAKLALFLRKFQQGEQT